MSTNDRNNVGSIWGALPLEAKVAVLTLLAEQTSIDNGDAMSTRAIDHGWMVVEGIAGARQLIDADAFAVLTGTNDARTPAGFSQAISGLFDEPSDENPALSFLTSCNQRDVDVALKAVHAAVTQGTDLTPPLVLQHEFQRLRSTN